MPIHDWSRVDAGIFHDFHLSWIHCLRTELNERLLPEPFYALAEPVAGAAVPDVLTLEVQVPAAGESAGLRALLKEESPGSAVALAPSKVLVQDLGPAYSRLARRIAIRSSLRDDKLVAVIEVVSPGNKDARLRSQHFVEKSVSFLEAGIHLLILDLHPPTPVVPRGFHGLICEDLGHQAPEIPGGRDLQLASYEVLEDGIPRAHVVGLRVGEPLPDMPVFLLPHHFVRMPLERNYDEAFRSLARKFRQILEGTATK